VAGTAPASGLEVVDFDRRAALEAAQIDRETRRRGRTIDAHDLFILASARVRGLSVATRDVAHFRGRGVSVFDPFSGAYAT
jgi:predicted nucleic acid-binding protein